MKQQIVVPRSSTDEYTLAIVTFNDPKKKKRGCLDERIYINWVMGSVKEAVTAWVSKTKAGRDCYKYVNDDLNIGDVETHGGIKYVRAYLKKEYNILNFDVQVISEDIQREWSFDTVLVE